jgi:hypothetical protein
VSTPWEGISPPSARVTATSSSPASPSPTSAPRWSTSRCRTSGRASHHHQRRCQDHLAGRPEEDASGRGQLHRR